MGWIQDKTLSMANGPWFFLVNNGATANTLLQFPPDENAASCKKVASSFFRMATFPVLSHIRRVLWLKLCGYA